MSQTNLQYAMWAVLALGTGSLAAVAATSAGRAAGAYHVAHDAAMDKSKQDEARALYIGHLLTACIMVLTMAFFIGCVTQSYYSKG